MLESVLRRFFHDRPGVPRPPDGVRVYAVGDIHGRSDLLRALHRRVAADAADAPDRDKRIVYLGDYIDRGLDSRGVIDILLDEPPPGVAPVHLMGNHEAMLLRFLEDSSIGTGWLQFGGVETLYSYGVKVTGPITDEAVVTVAQRRLGENLPERHLGFLRALDLYHRAGDYLFVHAGLRPGVSLEEQAEDDLLWIRDDFLRSRADHGHVVVHGHSIQPESEIRPNRIGIDTGAYATGVLTCLVLDGDERRFLRTRPGDAS
ncbi:MAG: metallophosphoesterase [Alphaproteobacteria bacterium]